MLIPNFKESSNQIRSSYKSLDKFGVDSNFLIFLPHIYKRIQERQRIFFDFFLSYINKPIKNLKVLEIGSGTGKNIMELIYFGFDANNLFANDISYKRVLFCRKQLPKSVKIFCGDALHLKYKKKFDIILLYTVFTSILNYEHKSLLANKIWSILEDKGAIVWYDFIYNNPYNNSVKGIKLYELKKLFPQAEIVVKKCTLLPPLAIFLCKIHPFLYDIFNVIPFFRTHIFCLIRKK